MRSSLRAQTIIGTGLLSNKRRNEASRRFNSVISTHKPMLPPSSACTRPRAIWMGSASRGRRRSRSFGVAPVGRPGFRAIAACFRFLCFVGRLFGIDAPIRILRAQLSAKCLKKWYQRPASAVASQFSSPFVARFRCPFRRRNGSLLQLLIGDLVITEAESCVANHRFPARGEAVQPVRELHTKRTKFDQRARRLSRS